MSKQTGLGDQLFVSGYDIGGDIQSIGNLATPVATIDLTGITKSAHERGFGLADSAGEFVSFFNDADDAAHEVLSNLPRANSHIMYLRGAGQGRQSFAMIGKRTDYAGSRGDDGSLTFNVAAAGDGSVGEWCVQLTDGKITHTAADAEPGVDLGAGAPAFGWQAYLQVFAFTGTSATISLETSADDGVGDPYAALTDGTFTTVTGRTVERLESSSATAAVERYVRVVTTGTFSSLVFAVVFNRNNATRYVR